MRISPVKPLLPVRFLLSNSVQNRQSKLSKFGFKQFALLSSLCAALYLYWEIYPAALVFALSVLLAVASIFYVDKHHAPILSQRMIIFQAYLLAILLTGITGGILSPLLAVMIHIPLLAFLLEGKRSSLIWAAISFFTFIMFWGLFALGISLPALHLRIDPTHFFFGNLTVLGIYVVLVFVQLISNRMKKYMDMQLKNKQLEHSLYKAISTKEELKNAFDRQAKGLQKTNEELDRFIYSSSHNLRGPLTSMMGLLNLCKMPADKEEIEQYLSLMEKCTQNLDSAISSTVQFAKNKHQEVSEEMVHVYDLISDSFYESRSLQEVANIDFQNFTDPSLVIQGDSERLQNIMHILISNAIQFRKKDAGYPIIRCRAFFKGKSFVLEVEDNGIGIAPEIRPHIFNMFYRGDKQGKGSGLGLYILRQILDKLQGKIEIESEPGEGTLVRVILPELQGPRPTNHRELIEAILIVDKQL